MEGVPRLTVEGDALEQGLETGEGVLLRKDKGMSVNRGLFTSASEHWSTPSDLYAVLDAEFGFDDDPCPLKSEEDGLDREWGQSTFVNPPYGSAIGKWLKKAYNESRKGKRVVCLIPSRTDTRWWHEYVMEAHEIRFLKGRLRFGDAVNSAPFPSAIAVFDGRNGL